MINKQTIQSSLFSKEIMLISAALNKTERKNKYQEIIKLKKEKKEKNTNF